MNPTSPGLVELIHGPLHPFYQALAESIVTRKLAKAKPERSGLHEALREMEGRILSQYCIDEVDLVDGVPWGNICLRRLSERVRYVRNWR